MKVAFFTTRSRFHRWLERNHDKSTELWVGFHKKHSGKQSITYNEALDEALCFGWIDGLRKSVNDISYTIRFTPRKAKSIWSRVNTKRAEELKELGCMKLPGLKAFAARDERRSGIYSFESAPRKLAAAYEKRFKANKKAWTFFQGQPPGYRRTASFWVMSAKQEETRLRRLARLVGDSAKGLRLAVITGSNRGRQRPRAER
jgi:uncharacterized protein YdeI (YjbR/CyaY-like superfamily)